MWKKIYDNLTKINISKIGKLLFILQVIVLLVLSYMIWYKAPRVTYFQNAEEETIWYGDGWEYVNQKGEPIAVDEHYLKLHKTKETVAITKILDDRVLDDKYLCFRVRAEKINIYLNDSLWQQIVFPEKRRAYASSVYKLYQIPVKGLHSG